MQIYKLFSNCNKKVIHRVIQMANSPQIRMVHLTKKVYLCSAIQERCFISNLLIAYKMTHRTLRHIASIILLAAYLPMVALSSLHVHHDTIDPEDQCGHCAGHFETQHHHQSDCLYCTFLSQSYLGQNDELSEARLPIAETISPVDFEPEALFRHGMSQLRAPPAHSCLPKNA